MMKTPSVSRRLVLRTGLAGLAGGVGAAALAACGETQVVTVEKIPVQTTVIKEVPVEKIIRETEVREVAVEKVVTQQVDRIVTQTVEVEKVVEKIVKKVVTQTVEKIVEIEKIVEVEKIVQAVAERAPGIDIHSLDSSVSGRPEAVGPEARRRSQLHDLRQPDRIRPGHLGRPQRRASSRDVRTALHLWHQQPDLPPSGIGLAGTVG